MTSKTDIILDRQHATIKLCIDELRRVLDDDDNWRALAALDSVSEAAGGVPGQGWLARRQELVSALDQNPVYVLFSALERALDVCPQTDESPLAEEFHEYNVETNFLGDTAPSEPGEPRGFDEQQEHLEQDAERDDLAVPSPAIAVETAEIRRESIAARIATLELPPFDSKLSDFTGPQRSASASAPAIVQSRDIEAPVAVIPDPSDVVADAAKNISATIAIPAFAATPDNDTEPNAGIAAQSGGIGGSFEEPIEPAVEIVSDGLNFYPPETIEDKPSEPASSNGASSPWPEPGDALASYAAEADVTQIYQGIFDYDAAALLKQPGFHEDDPEAEVSIVTRPATAPLLPSGSPDVAGELSADPSHDDESLEQRLQRLDRQSESLVRQSSSSQPLPATPSATESDEEVRANQWLEMIRARRAAMARDARLQVRPELPPEPIPDPSDEGLAVVEASPEPEEAEISIVNPRSSRQVSPRPANPSAVELADRVLGNGFEADVKIVQRKLPSPQSAPPSFRPLRVPGDMPLKDDQSRPRRTTTPVRKEANDLSDGPGGSYFGGVEEASVEIVRAGGHHSAAASIVQKQSPVVAPSVNRFMKALTGDDA